MTQTIERQTEQQRRLADLAAALVDSNVDAAEELARHLTHLARARKRPPGLALLVRWNATTERIEILTGQ